MTSDDHIDIGEWDEDPEDNQRPGAEAPEALPVVRLINIIKLTILNCII